MANDDEIWPTMWYALPEVTALIDQVFFYRHVIKQERFFGDTMNGFIKDRLQLLFCRFCLILWFSLFLLPCFSATLWAESSRVNEASYSFETVKEPIGAIPGAFEPASEPCETVSDPFEAMIISDLHFTTDQNASDVVVSGMRHAEEITDAIIDQVIRDKPDVFIMTGDNTNSGNSSDVEALIAKLQRIRDAGIRLVITTGNHDFANMDPTAFEEAYFSLIEADDRDENSLSYTIVTNDVVLLAMDDGATDPGGQGYFSRETMDWLRSMLEKYRDRHIIFLSHHNLLLGKNLEGAESFCIQNPDLSGLLEGKGIRLALTGHFHAQIILEENGLYEVISGMPFSGPHLMGRLQIENDHLSYRADPIDFEACGMADLAKAMKQTEERNAQLMKETFRPTVAESGLSEQRQEEVLDLIIRFLTFYTEGSMAENMYEITDDPAFEDMIRAMRDTNYGPWMQSVLAGKPLPATRLEVEF